MYAVCKKIYTRYRVGPKHTMMDNIHEKVKFEDILRLASR